MSYMRQVMNVKRGKPSTVPGATAAAAVTLTCPDDKMPLAIEIMRKHGIPVPGGQPNPTVPQLDQALISDLAAIGAALE